MDLFYGNRYDGMDINLSAIDEWKNSSCIYTNRGQRVGSPFTITCLSWNPLSSRGSKMNSVCWPIDGSVKAIVAVRFASLSKYTCTYTPRCQNKKRMQKHRNSTNDNPISNRSGVPQHVHGLRAYGCFHTPTMVYGLANLVPCI